MSLHKGARRHGRRGREARHTQPKEQPVVQATNPTAPTPPTPKQTLVEPQNVLDQLLAEAKHLRDFRKYNPKTFNGSLEDLTKAQMWLASVEAIFQYMKCPNKMKVQCAVFFFMDRGTTWWETIERMLDGDVNQITYEQFKENFYAKFFSASQKFSKQQKFLNLEQDNMTLE
ncbi:gag-protease polyprotein [Cucumis melo var. makuwa]|uniref:Gag-protease polyprotein n=1 Tax=Cucumis melo var. makuwa TaxID=1194695 RepID=A0A5D3DYQ7_CUCMM|nr:gag-protease polyprotein [Cucumis melo var. makuwa]